MGFLAPLFTPAPPPLQRTLPVQVVRSCFSFLKIPSPHSGLMHPQSFYAHLRVLVDFSRLPPPSCQPLSITLVLQLAQVPPPLYSSVRRSLRGPTPLLLHHGIFVVKKEERGD